jgi:natural product precursor
MEKLNLKKFEKAAIEKKTLNKVQGGGGPSGHWESDGCGGECWRCTDPASIE